MEFLLFPNKRVRIRYFRDFSDKVVKCDEFDERLPVIYLILITTCKIYISPVLSFT